MSPEPRRPGGIRRQRVRSGVLTHARPVLRVGPHLGAHRVAVRAGISVLVPLLAAVLTGHVGWTIYAAFGAFTSLYGRGHGYAERAGMQLVVGAALTASVTLGVLTSLAPNARWLAVGMGALVAAGGALISDAQRWHPPGPLFLVFAFTVCASVPGQGGEVGVAAAVAAASALFAVVIGGLGSVRPSRTSARPRFPRTDVVDVLRRPGTLTHRARYFVAAGLAGGISTALGWGHAYWAMVAAVVPMAAPDQSGRLLRAAHRIIGTGVGLGFAALLLPLHPHGVPAVLIIVALQIGAELLVGRNYGLALIFVTPLALMMGQLAHQLPIGRLLRDRALETALGVAIAVALTLLTRERDPAPRSRS